MDELAILGGKPVRTSPFMGRPHIDEKEKEVLLDCLEKKAFSRFIGSPAGNFRKELSRTSRETAELKDFWSVLGGEYVRLFEAEFAKRHGAAYAISMNSATSCLIAALMACGVGPGDEVITSPFTFTATATAIALAGARARFADIHPETYCLDLRSVKALLNDRTKAVLPVHILGNGADVHKLAALCREAKIPMIEDSAQALHAKAGGTFLGTVGEIGAFSFQETKNIMTGEGGMAVTNNPELAYRLRLIRNHGESMVFEGDAPERVRAARGYNFRLQEPIAAIGYVQVQKLEMLNDIRKKNYEVLKKELSRHSFLRFQEVRNDPGQFFPYCVGMSFNAKEFGVDRNLFAQALRAEGVPVSTGFPRLLNENLIGGGSPDQTPVAKSLNYSEYLGFFQVGYPNDVEDMKDIIQAFRKLVEQRDSLIHAAPGIPANREYDSGRL